jgi:hypothetical protein
LSIFRFLPGLLIAQLATAALLIYAERGGAEPNWMVLGVAALFVALVIGLWFGSVAEHVKKDALADAREEFARERERFLIAAEADKRTIVEESHEKIVRETNRAHARANFKLGAALVGVLGIAGVMIYIELITLGLLTLTTAGGALAGYVTRARQDSKALRNRAAEAALEAYTIDVPGNVTVERVKKPALTRTRQTS